MFPFNKLITSIDSLIIFDTGCYKRTLERLRQFRANFVANEFRSTFHRSLVLSQGNVRVDPLRNSGRQAIRIEAGGPLRLLTNVVLHVEFRVIRIIALLCLQVPKNMHNDSYSFDF